jgi:uncharacterized protein (TIGR02145 family)
LLIDFLLKKREHKQNNLRKQLKPYMIKNKPLLLAIAILILTINSIAQVTDKDGNLYKTVKIGAHEWMAQNLDVSLFRNGDSIPQAKTDQDWEKAGKEMTPAWCYYQNPANGKKYGKLYNWYAVVDPRGLAPEGWHVPTDSDYMQLINDAGGPMGEYRGGPKMKATSGWCDGSHGDNESGFTGLPGGNRGYDGSYVGIGDDGYWWSTTEKKKYTAMFLRLFCSSNAAGRYEYGADKGDGFSVRCIKD